MNSVKYILTIDVGTTSLKSVLFDLSGKLIHAVIREYYLEKPEPDIVELDPEVYWNAAKNAISEILIKTSVPPQNIKALGVTSQGETLILLDKNGNPLRKAIVWLDNRAKDESESIRKKFGRQLVYKITGQQDIAPCWPAAKILWLKNHENAIFRKTEKFLMLSDYIIYRLTGNFISNHAMNPSTLYYDLQNGCWWSEMLEFIGIDKNKLPSLLNSGETAGNVKTEIGLSHDTIVASAPIDQVAAALGAGNISAGMITETTGCAMALCATLDKPVYDPEMRAGIYRHAIPGLFIIMPWIPTAGMFLRWFRDEFANGESYNKLVDSAEKLKPGADGLIALPHLCGMNSPEINPDARGVFFGISPAHTKAHFVRAIMESVAFALRDNLELLKNLGVDSDELVSLGGAARSRLWLQIKADVIQKKLKTMNCEESTSLGTAILAAAACGAFPNIKEAIRAMVHSSENINPEIQNKKIYDTVFSQYKTLNSLLFAK